MAATMPSKKPRTGARPVDELACVILAAGLGTRMKSDTAKVLHPVAGRPLIEHSVALALAAGARRVVVVLGHQAERVRAALDARFGAGAVRVAIQERPLGTGHAAAQALPALEGWAGPVLILYGDVPLLRRDTVEALKAAYASSRAPLAAVTADFADPTGYGRMVRDRAGALRRVVEEKDCTARERRLREINAGIYLVESAFLASSVAALTADNAQGELYLTDLVAGAARARRGPVPTVRAGADEILGVNDRVQLAVADRLMRLRVCDALQRAGVSIRAPESTFIDAGVEVGRDTVIGPNVILAGRTRVGAGCRVNAGCVLTDTVVGDGAHVKPMCVATEAEVGPGAQVGPFAHLRPGAALGEAAHVGNFVELKNARLGRGSKANHLAYLGDADIGEDVNVGAGTITCNYDGVNKERTVLEDGVFIGSDTQLVAPVRVGRGAYVGAGATVDSDVPAGALYLTRAPSVVKEGYAATLRERALARKAAKTAKRE